MHAILRTYNNPRIVDIIRRLKATRRVTGFTVVINARQDSLDTPELLRELEFHREINCVLLEDFGWAKALNAGLKSLPPISSADELVLTVSNEVEVTSPEIDLAISAALQDSSSCGYALFDGRREPSYSVPRNTFTIRRRNIFDRIGLFQESFDQRAGTGTGMEDYELVLRAFSVERLLPFVGPKAVKLIRSPSNEKLAWENEGIEIIERDYPTELVTEMRNHLYLQNRNS